MKFRWRSSRVIVALGLALAACGEAEPNRFDLRTPGANTGHGPAATASPNPTATPPAGATPAPEKPVTRIERRVIKGWSDTLRRGRVKAAARYFSIPSLVSNDAPSWQFLDTPAKVEDFNRTLTCGAKLIRTRRGVDQFVVGIFRLTERKGRVACGTGLGKTAAVAFLIRKERITQWVRVDPDAPDPGATPTPTPAPTSSATPRMS